MEIIKNCYNKFNQTLYKKRNCKKCNSLQPCIEQTENKTTRKYISINQLDDNDLKEQIKQTKQQFWEYFKSKDISDKTIQHMWTLLKRICIISEKSPNELTILDFNDYFETKEDDRYLIALISYSRRICRDYLHLNDWNALQAPQRQSKFIKEVIPNEFYESNIYKLYTKWFNTYKPYLDNNTTAKDYNWIYTRYLYYCWTHKTNDFNNPSKMMEFAKEWILTLDIRRTSKNHYRTVLKQFFEASLKTYDFKHQFKSFKIAKPRIKEIPTDDEVTQLLQYTITDKTNQWCYPLMTTLVYTGIRISDICKLKLDNIDLKNNMFRLFATKTGDKDILILPILKPVLERWIKYHKKHFKLENRLFITNDNKYIKPDTVRKHLRTISNRLNIKYYPPHHYRARIALTIYEKSGWNLSFVKDFLGHDSIKTTERYIKGYRKDIMQQNYSYLIPDLLPGGTSNKVKLTENKKKAYRKLVKKHHPDMNTDKSDITEEEFKKTVKSFHQ